MNIWWGFLCAYIYFSCTSVSSLHPRSSQTQSKPAGRFGPGTAGPQSPPGQTACTRARWTGRTGDTGHQQCQTAQQVNAETEDICVWGNSQQALRRRTEVQRRKPLLPRSACRGQTPQWTSITAVQKKKKEGWWKVFTTRWHWRPLNCKEWSCRSAWMC